MHIPNPVRMDEPDFRIDAKDIFVIGNFYLSTQFLSQFRINPFYSLKHLSLPVLMDCSLLNFLNFKEP